MSHPFRWSLAIYRLFILAYPRRFRQRFREDLMADFREMLQTETAKRPLLGRLSCWQRMLRDRALGIFDAVDATA